MVNLIHGSLTQQELLLDFKYFSCKNYLQGVEAYNKVFFSITFKTYSNGTQFQDDSQQE